MAAGKAKELPSFWVPSQTPDSKPVIVPKPDQTIYCPSGSGKVLKIKDLIGIIHIILSSNLMLKCYLAPIFRCQVYSSTK